MTAPPDSGGTLARTTRAATRARSVLNIALGFVREHMPESSTRLCAVLLCLTGCSCALATVRFAFLHPERTAMVTALVGVTSALIASGCVAIINRTQKTCESIAAAQGDAG